MFKFATFAAAVCSNCAAALLNVIVTSPSIAQQSIKVHDIAVERYGDFGPVVVFENGMGTSFVSWRPIAKSLAFCMQAILYDRTGVGASGSRIENGLRLAGDVASQLDKILLSLDISRPIILVGHSLGGLYVQAFARALPNDVRGMVLVDAVSPLEPKGAFVSTISQPVGSTAYAEEAGLEPSIEKMLVGPPFPPIPLVVLSAPYVGSAELKRIWRETHQRTAVLSPKGRFVEVTNSGHFIQTDQPMTVIEAIISVARDGGADISNCPRVGRQ
jgi:hypothetical protein